jgi:transposase, IS5 family
MFRTVGDGPSLWEASLPPELLRLPDDLVRVDALLDDPAFFAPFAPYFHPVLGRPSTPVECYLRLMFLKFRHRSRSPASVLPQPRSIKGTAMGLKPILSGMAARESGRPWICLRLIHWSSINHWARLTPTVAPSQFLDLAAPATVTGEGKGGNDDEKT